MLPRKIEGTTPERVTTAMDSTDTKQLSPHSETGNGALVAVTISGMVLKGMFMHRCTT